METSASPTHPASSSPRVCLVTGANGFVGSHLVDRLIALGHDVRILCRETSDLSNLAAAEGKYTKFIGDITDAESVERAVAGCHWVFHVAGLTSAPNEEVFTRVNGEGTAVVFRATQKAAAETLERFVYVCSQAAGGPAPSRDKPVTEESPDAPMSLYGKSKKLGEERIKELDAADGARTWPWVILRPTAVYGPRDADILEFFKLVKSGALLFGLRPYFGIPSAMTGMIHVHDLVDACVVAAEAPGEVAVGKTYLIANPDSYYIADLLGIIQRALPKKLVMPVYVPLPLLRALAGWQALLHKLFGWKPSLTPDKAREISARWWICDPGKVTRELQWTPQISVEDGLTQTADWYREQGWL